MPFSPWPSFTEEEAEAVQRVLLSNRVNFWTGQECQEFEREFAGFTESEYAIAVTNGSLALELALRGLGIETGDEVIVTPRTFFASASCIVNVGAEPVFADVNRDSQNVTAATIAPHITPRTRAIICVHLAGMPCDMGPIMALAAEHDLFVIEDCAQAHGARYRGRAVGSIGHVGAWSFCQDKIMTTGGEGGMVTTNDEALWRRMWSLKDHGKSFDAVHAQQHAPGFRWLHESFGSNYRMTEMQAAIGRIQLGRMGEWTLRRNANARRIREAARSCRVLRVPDLACRNADCRADSQGDGARFSSLPRPGETDADRLCCTHGQYKCYVFVRPERLATGWSRDRILEEINAAGVPCFSGSCSEVYLEKAFEGTGFRPGRRLPVAKELGETSLMFLVHPTLTAGEIDRTCDVLRQVGRRAAA